MFLRTWKKWSGFTHRDEHCPEQNQEIGSQPAKERSCFGVLRVARGRLLYTCCAQQPGRAQQPEFMQMDSTGKSTSLCPTYWDIHAVDKMWMVLLLPSNELVILLVWIQYPALLFIWEVLVVQLDSGCSSNVWEVLWNSSGVSTLRTWEGFSSAPNQFMSWSYTKSYWLTLGQENNLGPLRFCRC